MLVVAPKSYHLPLAVQDLDSMRQDLATYASDIKSEQDHAVSVMLVRLCSVSSCKFHNLPAMSSCCLL